MNLSNLLTIFGYFIFGKHSFYEKLFLLKKYKFSEEVPRGDNFFCV